ncbi:MAG: SRPBCC domain-containing protein [Myxococcales bacterium FL481]|nr:MAG: SRPBCC domain-containing protein [Myxococcales bacterium FL481]
MKRSLKIVAIVGLFLGGSTVALSLFGHKSVHAELVIPATPDMIWSVLTDTANYPEWNPVFVQVVGEHREGAKLTYQMKDQTGKTTEVVATVVKLDPERELNQFGGIRGVLTFDHHWRLEAVDGGTKVTQHEDYRGIGVWFWDPSWFETAYANANTALRERVATLAGTTKTR